MSKGIGDAIDIRDDTQCWMYIPVHKNYIQAITIARKDKSIPPKVAAVKKEGFVRTMLRKIADFVKKIFRVEPIPTAVNTMWEAIHDLEVARNHFENCDPEFVDAAIFELNAAECRVDAVRRCVV